MSRSQKTRARNKRNQKKQAQHQAQPCHAIGCTRTTTSPMGYCFYHSDMVNYKKDKVIRNTVREEFEAKEAGLPVTLSILHQQMGVDEFTMCEACKRGDHWDCNLATWCQCDDDGDGNPDAYSDYDPYDLP